MKDDTTGPGPTLPRLAGRALRRGLIIGVEMAVIALLFGLGLTGVTYAFDHWLGGRPDPASASTAIGWILTGALVMLIIFDKFRPRHVRQALCMHHSPHIVNPDTGAPTVSWIAHDRISTSTSPGRQQQRWRKFWCTHCRKVFLFRQPSDRP